MSYRSAEGMSSVSTYLKNQCRGTGIVKVKKTLKASDTVRRIAFLMLAILLSLLFVMKCVGLD